MSKTPAIQHQARLPGIRLAIRRRTQAFENLKSGPSWWLWSIARRPFTLVMAVVFSAALWAVLRPVHRPRRWPIGWFLANNLVSLGRYALILCLSRRAAPGPDAPDALDSPLRLRHPAGRDRLGNAGNSPVSSRRQPVPAA
ncbi:MAG: hypothetical protein MZW92_14885 [Comamonadaceae bacterium]|nr:hypothetical protein [Comamonadaceae bacterium]